MRKSKTTGKFYEHEVKRCVPDVVRFIVYLGVGGHLHACSKRKLHKAFRNKVKYSDMSWEDFELMMTQVHQRKEGLWTIKVGDNHVAVV